MLFSIKVNGKDFYSFEEAGKKDEHEEKVYRIGIRNDEKGIVKSTYFDMRINSLDETCVLSYDPRTCILKCVFDKEDRPWNVPDLEEEDAFPIHFWHQKFELSVTIDYDKDQQALKLAIDKKPFELLPYWVP